MSRLGTVRAIALSAGGLVLAMGALAAGSARAQDGSDDQVPLRIEAIDTLSHPRISIEVSAPAPAEGGAYPSEAFSVTENGVSLPAEVTKRPTEDLEIMLVIDVSGSMRGDPLTAAKRAVADFVAVLSPEVRAGAVAFGPSPVLVAAPTTDRPGLLAAVNGLEAGGDTALYDAVRFSVEQFTAAAADREIVLLSDGGDTASLLSLPVVLDGIRAAGARVSVISLVTETTNADALRQIAQAGSGRVSAVTDPASLASLYRVVATGLVNRYLLTVESAAYGSANLSVRLATGGGVLEAVEVVSLPAAPVTAATTLAPTTPAPTSPATTAAPSFVQVPGPATNPRVWLYVGALAAFLAVFLFVLVALPEDRRTRRARANLALRERDFAAEASSARERVVSLAERLVSRSGRGSALARMLDAAGMTMTPGELVTLVGVVALFTGLAGLLAGGPVAAAALMGLVVLVARAVIRWKAELRRDRFLEQLPDTVQVLTTTLRSGFGLLQAMDSVASQAAEPMREELKRVLLEQRVGRDLGESLVDLSHRMRSTDVEWLAEAIAINQETGGDLAVILENVARTIRARRHVARQVRALSAEGRISAYVLLGLPIAVAGLLALINPDYLGEFASTAGVAVLCATGLLMVVGWIWMRKLVKVEY
jgi:tight adherence protein B